MMKGKEMGEAKVALVCCETYEETAVYQAMKKGMDLLGGIRRFGPAGRENPGQT